MANIDFVIPDVVSIEEVTEKTFTILGNDGLIQPAIGHACAECSQPYRATSDFNTVAAPIVQSSAQMKNVTMRVLDGMVNGTKVFFK